MYRIRLHIFSSCYNPAGECNRQYYPGLRFSISAICKNKTQYRFCNFFHGKHVKQRNKLNPLCKCWSRSWESLVRNCRYMDAGRGLDLNVLSLSQWHHLADVMLHPSNLCNFSRMQISRSTREHIHSGANRLKHCSLGWGY